MVSLEWRNNFIVLIIMAAATIFLVISLSITSTATVNTAHNIETIVNKSALNITNTLENIVTIMTDEINSSNIKQEEIKTNLTISFSNFKNEIIELLSNISKSIDNSSSS